MLKIRRSRDRLIFNMEYPYTGQTTCLYWDRILQVNKAVILKNLVQNLLWFKIKTHYCISLELSFVIKSPIVNIYSPGYSTCPAGPFMPAISTSGSSSASILRDSWMVSFNRAVFSQLWPSLSSTQSDRSTTILWSHLGSHFISPWMFVTQSFAYAGGQPSGTYSRQLLPWRPSDVEAGGELWVDWHFLGSWSQGMLTCNWSPSNAITSPSDHGCPHPGSIVRPSAVLPAIRGRTPSIFQRASPDVRADRAAVLLHTTSSPIRMMAQLGNTASTIKSHKACNNTIYLYLYLYICICIWFHSTPAV